MKRSTRVASAPGALAPEVAAYVASSYPHNHDYRLVRGRLRPSWKLWCRDRKLRKHLPRPLESLVDLSSCKGWFVLQALAREGCLRALGVDVFERDLEASRAVRDRLGLSEARFEQLYLHELAERIDEYGGPFQTALLVNAYQYFYFGSERDRFHYGSHAEIFAHLRRVCAGRLIFSNRVELPDCPRHIQAMAREQGRGEEYTEARVVEAAEAHFRVRRVGRLGRIPLWVLDAI